MYKTVKQFIQANPAFSNGWLRKAISEEKNNGFSEAKVIKRLGRKVLINDTAFFNWLENFK